MQVFDQENVIENRKSLNHATAPVANCSNVRHNVPLEAHELIHHNIDWWSVWWTWTIYVIPCVHVRKSQPHSNKSLIITMNNRLDTASHKFKQRRRYIHRFFVGKFYHNLTISSMTMTPHRTLEEQSRRKSTHFLLPPVFNILTWPRWCALAEHSVLVRMNFMDTNES